MIKKNTTNNKSMSVITIMIISVIAILVIFLLANLFKSLSNESSKRKNNGGSFGYDSSYNNIKEILNNK